jgi:predicted transglutaminase-like cysteine proteinase
MPKYTKDVSAFTKWSPVKNWFQNNPFAIPAAMVPTVTICDKINRKVNKSFVYIRDGISDTWRTPPQFVSNGGGDCEDFAVYKMSLLAKEGVPLASMELVICFDKFSREYHNVLRVFDGQSEYILDNQNVSLLSKASFNQRYAPIYAIGMSGWRVCTA